MSDTVFRPPTGKGREGLKGIMVRLPSAEYEAIEKRCHALGSSMNAFLVEAIRFAMEHIEEPKP